METGHEKLRYVAGHSTIFYKNTVEYVSLDEKHAAIVQNCWVSLTIN